MTDEYRERVRQANRQHQTRLIKHPDVVAVGVGMRVTGGQSTGESCVKLFVSKKLPKELVAPERLLPTHLMLDESTPVATDIEESDPITAPPPNLVAGVLTRPAFSLIASPQLTARQRPAFGGVSAAHCLFPAGTMSITAYDRLVPNLSYVLSCNHVLGLMNQARFGDAVLQPASGHGGTFPADSLASFARFVRVSFDPNGTNKVDAAIATVFAGTTTPFVYRIGAIPAVRRASGILPGEQVQKVGSATGLTTGTIRAVDAMVNISYKPLGFSFPPAPYTAQILTTAMCLYGDSGSLLMDMSGNAVGMLMGGSKTVTIYNYMENVQDGLGIFVAHALI